MDYFQLITAFFTDGMPSGLADWIIHVLAFWGLLDLYAFLRWKKKGAGKIDQTASLWHWISVKWLFASQTDIMAEKLPFIKQDMSEALGVKKDDGNVS